MPVVLLLVLVLADLAFLAVSAFKEPAGRWQIQLNGSYPEIFGYLQTAAAVGLLLATYRSTRRPPYLALAGVVALIVLDDLIGIHEAFGRWFAASGVSVLGFLPLGVEEVGELVAWVGLGAACVGLLVAGYRNADAVARQCIGFFVVALAVLMSLSVGVDAVHSTLSGQAGIVAGYLEDGGELVLLSVIFALSVMTHRRIGRSSL